MKPEAPNATVDETGSRRDELLASRAACQAFAKEHLAECAGDLVSLSEAGVLSGNTRFRQLQQMVAAWAGAAVSMSLAQRMVEIEALRQATGSGCRPMSQDEDWVRVPREPTPAMREAHAIYGDTSDWWNAVLAAVPGED